MNDNLNIYVLQHKPYENKHQNLESRIPLQVGSWDKEQFCVMRDCDGDNISNKNKVYLETTGHYWALKNDNLSSYVGFEHCCRQFLEFDSEEKIITVLKDYDIILPQSIIPKTTIEIDYANCHIHNDILVCKDILYDMDEEVGRLFEIYIYRLPKCLFIGQIFL